MFPPRSPSRRIVFPKTSPPTATSKIPRIPRIPRLATRRTRSAASASRGSGSRRIARPAKVRGPPSPSRRRRRKPAGSPWWTWTTTPIASHPRITAVSTTHPVSRLRRVRRRSSPKTRPKTRATEKRRARFRSGRGSAAGRNVRGRILSRTAKAVWSIPLKRARRARVSRRLPRRRRRRRRRRRPPRRGATRRERASTTSRRISRASWARAPSFSTCSGSATRRRWTSTSIACVLSRRANRTARGSGACVPWSRVRTIPFRFTNFASRRAKSAGTARRGR
mmetsp:Transcript_15249/g.65296  ORF Transcript_15249/g.65296 Transcript_15249/m.65296 type:complete len:280 (-) Transcript_15249:725-1564(-)